MMKYMFNLNEIFLQFKEKLHKLETTNFINSKRRKVNPNSN